MKISSNTVLLTLLLDIHRQSVKLKDDHFASIQMNTSKSDVVFKLAVLDNEEEVISVEGKGHAVIPAFTFLKTITQEDFDKRSGSRACKLNAVVLLLVPNIL